MHLKSQKLYLRTGNYRQIQYCGRIHSQFAQPPPEAYRAHKQHTPIHNSFKKHKISRNKPNQGSGEPLQNSTEYKLLLLVASLIPLLVYAITYKYYNMNIARLVLRFAFFTLF